MAYHMYYYSCYQTFMGVLCRFHHITIISALLHWLLYTLLYTILYIFSEISTYFYDFQRVNTRYHQIFKKKVYYFFKKNVIVTRGNALENGQLYTYFTENVLGDIQ